MSEYKKRLGKLGAVCNEAVDSSWFSFHYCWAESSFRSPRGCKQSQGIPRCYRYTQPILEAKESTKRQMFVFAILFLDASQWSFRLDTSNGNSKLVDVLKMEKRRLQFRRSCLKGSDLGADPKQSANDSILQSRDASSLRLPCKEVTGTRE